MPPDNRLPKPQKEGEEMITTDGLRAKALLLLCALMVFSVGASAQRNGTTLAASKTIDICRVSDTVWRYSGEVSLWNEGAINTEGLAIQDCIQSKTGRGQFQNRYCLNLQVTEQLLAGTTQETATTYPYSILGAPLPGDIRNVASVTITNHSGSVGRASGPSPKATWLGGVPPACSSDGGCTRTQGYWKNHEENWPGGYDPAGTFFLSGDTWLGVLNTEPQGSAYYILAHQYIAAVLNQASGTTVPSGVQDILNLASAWLAANAPGDCSPGSCGLQVTWAGILDDYNNGVYEGGPPHCE